MWNDVKKCSQTPIGFRISAMFFQCSVSNKYKQKISKKLKSLFKLLHFFPSWWPKSVTFSLFKSVTKPSFCKLRVDQGSIHWPYVTIFPCQKWTHWIVSQSQHLDYNLQQRRSSVCLAFPWFLAWFLACAKNSINICSIMCSMCSVQINIFEISS